jgi:sugar lactone lactonase YvrE
VILLLVAVAAAFWAAPVVVDPQSKLFAVTYKVQQFLLAPWLSPSYLGDGGPATELLLCAPMGLALDDSGGFYVSDRGRLWRGRVVWLIDANGVAHVVAGTGRQGDAVATEAAEISFGKPEGIALDPHGRLHVADAVRHAIYRIEHDGTVTRIAGTGSGSGGMSGDGGSAVEAQLNRPAEIRFDRKGNLYIADVFNHRIRKVDSEGRISTVAGTGSPGFTADGHLAIEARLDTPWGLGIDQSDRLLIADTGNNRIRRIEQDGTIVTLAGNGLPGFSGNGVPALDASFDAPQAIFVDSEGRLFVGDEHNHAVRVIDIDGTITTLMGIGTRGLAAAGSSAEGSPLNDPENLAVRNDGSVIIVEGRNGRVIRVDPDGTVQHIAGRGEIDDCTSRIPSLSW